jgi:hypothetical protein
MFVTTHYMDEAERQRRIPYLSNLIVNVTRSAQETPEVTPQGMRAWR